MRPTIICLTPVKNEEWCLDDFLKSASLWADYIIICDQMSTDGSRDIAMRYPKVRLIDNPSPIFNEPERQKMLIDEARKIKGKRLLITLDADEMFSPEFLDENNQEWKDMLNAGDGTVFRFQWANLHPDGEHCWYTDYHPWGYMDDGYEHTSNSKIHSTRIPMPSNTKMVDIKSVKVIHRQYIDWKRMESKHRWYQAYERITYPQKSVVDIFRMYHHMYQMIKINLEQIPIQWEKEYAEYDISFTNFRRQEYYWFDEEFAKLIDRHGAETFKGLRVWGSVVKKAWKAMGRENYYDPRTWQEKFMHWWLFNTQQHWDERSLRGRIIRYIDKKMMIYK